MNKMLTRSFYEEKTEQVAKNLLGKYLVHKENNILKIGKIVETEAYLGPHDLAAHSRFGKTKRNIHLFGPPGFSYVYLIYGIHHCFNVTTEKGETGSAVLIRAVEPIENIHQKTSGPGLVCKAMNINLKQNGIDLTKSEELFLTDGEGVKSEQIVESVRVGVSYAGVWKDEKLRFFIKNNPFVSHLLE